MITLKVKDMDIASGGPLVAIINEKDAEKMDFHHLDRIKVIYQGKIETVVIDIGKSEKAVPIGGIGLYEEVLDSLNVVDGETIEIMPARKPLSLDFIKKKLDGFKLSKNEIDQIVWDIVHNKLSAIELTYFVAACYSHKLDSRETTLLTKAMVAHGEKLKLNRYPILDKHCIGGVAGNRTTMVIVPIIAAAGLTIPKTSSRSITSPAGTGDTMEVLADVTMPIERMKKIVEKTNGCIIWGGSLNLAPADDKIIKVEKPLAIDAESQLLASVIAKKASVSATHLVIDIPCGNGAKLSNKKRALQLKKDFEDITKRMGIKTKVLITDGKQPIGNGIGPCLEARDVLWILKNDRRGPADLRKKCLMIAGVMLEMAGKCAKGKGKEIAKEILKSGKAYNKMVEIIKAQGEKIINPEDIKIGKITYDVVAKKKGVVKKISNRSISKIARVAGAPENQGAGIYLYKHIGDKIKKGEKLFTIYCYSKHKLDFAKYALEKLDGVVVK
ncbi:MAG: AMP phosphorylase [Nanoarchaeota archaeon]|nr:AMP phosphorylase [Nanoarchaeota archaeon]MBU1004810.1 AMP phosphorylase [Nanoarchaeota archaeon]MBU1946617.1 AMP phosphorylase [Nanoarchaeota archaeon]